jgi:hypothetical protein
MAEYAQSAPARGRSQLRLTHWICIILMNKTWIHTYKHLGYISKSRSDDDTIGPANSGWPGAATSPFPSRAAERSVTPPPLRAPTTPPRRREDDEDAPAKQASEAYVNADQDEEDEGARGTGARGAII